MNPTKTTRALLALSLMANAALGWMLWQERQHSKSEQTIAATLSRASTPPSTSKPVPATVPKQIQPSTPSASTSQPPSAPAPAPIVTPPASSPPPPSAPPATTAQATSEATSPPATSPTQEAEPVIPRVPRIEPPLPPPTRAGTQTTKSDTVLFSKPKIATEVDPNNVPAYLRLEQPQLKPYGPPLPPNPYAVPPWQERLPYREDQMPRGLYSTPLKLDK